MCPQHHFTTWCLFSSFARTLGRTLLFPPTFVPSKENNQRHKGIMKKKASAKWRSGMQFYAVNPIC